MKLLSNRLDFFTESIIRKMTRIANEYDAINLSQGFPDFDPPQVLIDSLIDAAKEGHHQYEITWGSQLFREALAKKQSYFMEREIDPNKEIVVTCGSTEAMMASMLAVCDKGDKVIVFSPFYENYVADTVLSGAEPIYVNLRPPEFEFDKSELEEAFKQDPKAIIICNPSNPTGKVFTKEELTYIGELACKYDTYVITDEVYEHIVFPPYKHTYMATLPGMFERTINCGSLSKTYSITGWRLGYVIAPETITNEIRKVHDFLTVGAAAPLQKAALAGLELPQSYYDELQKEYTEKRDFFIKGLDEAGLSYVVPQGAYYVMVDISEFTDKGDEFFCEWLIKEVGVAAVPGSSFFKEDVNHLIRFHFAKKKETLEAAIDKLKTVKEKASQTISK